MHQIERDGRVDAGDGIVEHDAEATFQIAIEPVGRPGLDGVGEAEQEEADAVEDGIERHDAQGQPLRGDLVDHHRSGIADAEMLGINAAGPDADEEGEHSRRNEHQRIAGPPNDESGEGQCCERSPAARRDRQEAGAEPGGKPDGGMGDRQVRRQPAESDLQLQVHAEKTTVAVACAAMPSRRPVNPSPSVVVALTLTRAASRPSVSASRATMAPRCGPTFGRSQMIVTSTWLKRPPRPVTRPSAWRRKVVESAPFQRGSEGGKCVPISPAPMAPSSASVSACKPTSASEWPSKPCSCATATPHSMTLSPGPKRCTS